MKQYDLSIVIPAGKKEEFTAQTVADILKNKRGNTEIIVIMDGWWVEPGIDDHVDVRVIRLTDPIGQRAAQNLGVRMSHAKYVMKLDSHCAVDEGFDVKMLEAFKESGDNVTMVPVMRNLHVFDWVCEYCGMRTYQGPEPEECRSETCSFDEKKFKKDVVWISKTSPQSTAYRFNKELRFKYFPELRRKQQGNLVESLSLQGSCFMCTRENYWKLELCNENWGGWGQQGSEVALKTWLSGGRVLCNINTWYAHMFRTQRGFSHPWGNPGKDQQNAIQECQDLFLNNKWPLQVKPLSWLLEKFWPELQQVGDNEAKWEQADLDRLKKVKIDKHLQTFINSDKGPSKGILYYTTNRLPIRLAKKIQKNLKSIGLPITSVSLKPMPGFGTNIHMPLQPGVLTYFTQILVGLESMKEDIIFFCEHDCLYPQEHFEFTPPTKDKFYYDQNWWKIWPDGFAARWDANQVSGLVAYREHLIDFYRAKIKEIEAKGFNRSYEPGSRDKALYEVWKSPRPMVDIRHGDNLTRSHRKPEDFRDKSSCVNWQEATVDTVPGWKKRDIV